MVVNNSISSKKLRKMIKDEKSHLDDFTNFTYPSSADEKEKSMKTFDKSIIALRIALNRLATLIEKTEDNWVLYEILMNHKNIIHSQIDLLIREKKQYVQQKSFL